jgi:hypothetical protein
MEELGFRAWKGLGYGVYGVEGLGHRVGGLQEIVLIGRGF